MAPDDTDEMTIENSEIQTDPFKILIENLALNDKVICKSQQKDEIDLTINEKIAILTEMLNQNKATFLFRFGQFLDSEELKLFEQFLYNPNTGYEVAYYLNRFQQLKSAKFVKNRRYFAVKRLSTDAYFSEKEMRRRNPLLYDQLVGVYLSDKERQIRDIQECTEKTLVTALMDGIDKEEAEFKRIRQEEAEDAAMEEENDEDDLSSSDGEFEYSPDSSKPSCSVIQNNFKQPGTTNKTKNRSPRFFWGEIDNKSEPKRIKKPITDAQLSISAQERRLLKEEFCSTMFESFLDGQDDFDYSSIDNNEEYDNLEILNHDEEEKYFDSEDAEDVTVQQSKKGFSENESEEDELEVFMGSLNKFPVQQLTEAMQKL